MRIGSFERNVSMLPPAVRVVLRPNAFGFRLSTRSCVVRVQATAELTSTSAFTAETRFEVRRRVLTRSARWPWLDARPFPITRSVLDLTTPEMPSATLVVSERWIVPRTHVFGGCFVKEHC